MSASLNAPIERTTATAGSACSGCDDGGRLFTTEARSAQRNPFPLLCLLCVSVVSMFAKILIANRGEIACRVIRTARAARDRARSRSIPRPTRDALHVAEADEAWSDRPGAGARQLSRTSRAIIAAAQAQRRRGDPSGLRLPVGECGFRRGLRRGGPDLRRAAGRSDARHGLEGGGQDADGASRRAAGAGLSRRRRRTPAVSLRRPRAHRLSGADQGLGRRRRRGMRVVAEPANSPQRSKAQSAKPPRPSATTGC